MLPIPTSQMTPVPTSTRKPVMLTPLSISQMTLIPANQMAPLYFLNSTHHYFSDGVHPYIPHLDKAVVVSRHHVDTVELERKDVGSVTHRATTLTGLRIPDFDGSIPAAAGYHDIPVELDAAHNVSVSREDSQASPFLHIPHPQRAVLGPGDGDVSMHLQAGDWL